MILFYDRQDIKVPLFIVYKLKLKFIISFNTRVRYIWKSSLGIFFSYRSIARAGQIQNGGRFDCTKSKLLKCFC